MKSMKTEKWENSMKLMVPALKPADQGLSRQEASQHTVELLEAIDALLAEAPSTGTGPGSGGSRARGSRRRASSSGAAA